MNPYISILIAGAFIATAFIIGVFVGMWVAYEPKPGHGALYPHGPCTSD